MRRAKLEGRHIGRWPLDVDRDAIVQDRRRGLSLTEVAEALGAQLGHSAQEKSSAGNCGSCNVVRRLQGRHPIRIRYELKRHKGKGYVLAERL